LFDDFHYTIGVSGLIFIIKLTEHDIFIGGKRMIMYMGFLYVILSSLYTLSYAKQTWQDNKAASLGAILLVFISMGVAIFIYLRT
jgi:hypothetical protein